MHLPWNSASNVARSACGQSCITCNPGDFPCAEPLKTPTKPFQPLFGQAVHPQAVAAQPLASDSALSDASGISVSHTLLPDSQQEPSKSDEEEEEEVRIFTTPPYCNASCCIVCCLCTIFPLTKLPFAVDCALVYTCYGQHTLQDILHIVPETASLSASNQLTAPAHRTSSHHQPILVTPTLAHACMRSTPLSAVQQCVSALPACGHRPSAPNLHSHSSF